MTTPAHINNALNRSAKILAEKADRLHRASKEIADLVAELNDHIADGTALDTDHGDKTNVDWILGDALHHIETCNANLHIRDILDASIRINNARLRAEENA